MYRIKRLCSLGPQKHNETNYKNLTNLCPNNSKIYENFKMALKLIII